MIKHYFLALFVIYSAPSVAICSGEWRLNIDNTNYEYRQNKDAYIPVYLELSSDVVNCKGPYAFITIANQKNGQLKNRKQSLTAEIVDSNARPLSYSPDYGYRLPLSRGQQTRFWIKVNDARTAPAGTYSNMLDADLQLDNRFETKSKRAHIDIESFVSFKQQRNSQVVGNLNSDTYTIDLGKLESGKQYSTKFELISNANVKLEISQKYGQLQHTKRANWYVPYSLDFNRLTISDNQKFKLSNQNGLNRWLIPMNIEIGSTDFARSGYYQDIIEIEVKAEP
ncbi:hypothetical protein ABXV23_19040 [Vibrio owensii]|uniref:hypothetical protein n=1 Tax=Vibrio owensii TaxID=696485 RepID=UPI0018F232C9|nr:hypothetical protein [Vibrio owensii]